MNKTKEFLRNSIFWGRAKTLLWNVGFGLTVLIALLLWAYACYWKTILWQFIYGDLNSNMRLEWLKRR